MEEERSMMVVFYPKKQESYFDFLPSTAPFFPFTVSNFFPKSRSSFAPFHRSGRAEEISRRGRGILIYVFGALSCLPALKCSRWGKEGKEEKNVG